MLKCEIYKKCLRLLRLIAGYRWNYWRVLDVERQPRREMAKLLTALFLLTSLLICYFVSHSSNPRMLFPSLGVEATNGHGSPLEGRDRHHHERGGHIRRKSAHWLCDKSLWDSIDCRRFESLLASLWRLQSAEHHHQSEGTDEETLRHFMQLQVHLVFHNQVKVNCNQF